MTRFANALSAERATCKFKMLRVVEQLALKMMLSGMMDR